MAEEISYQEITIEFMERLVGEDEDKFAFKVQISYDTDFQAQEEPVEDKVDLTPVLELLGLPPSIPSDPTRGERITDAAINDKLISDLALNEDVGKKLYECLITNTPKLAPSYTITKFSAKTDDSRKFRLKIKIDLDSVSEVASLPWELMYDTLEQTGVGFLAVHQHTSLIRHIKLENNSFDKLTIDDPHILIAIANPDDTTKLQTDKEKEAIIAGIKDKVPEANIKILDPATREDLRFELNNNFQIFHFIGHADFIIEEDVKEGRLIVAKDATSKEKDYVTSNELGDWLAGSETQLVFLNGCNSAVLEATDGYNPLKSNDGYNPYTGLATGILQWGIPAVIAMQREVKDDKAIAFAKNFYKYYLYSGEDIEQSTYQARNMIADTFTDKEKRKMLKDMDWAIPVLFLRT